MSRFIEYSYLTSWKRYEHNTYSLPAHEGATGEVSRASPVHQRDRTEDPHREEVMLDVRLVWIDGEERADGKRPSADGDRPGEKADCGNARPQ